MDLCRALATINEIASAYCSSLVAHDGAFALRTECLIAFVLHHGEGQAAHAGIEWCESCGIKLLIQQCLALCRIEDGHFRVRFFTAVGAELFAAVASPEACQTALIDLAARAFASVCILHRFKQR